MSVHRGIAGWVARNRQALRQDDASQDSRHERSMESETNFRPRGMICVPLVCKGTLLGVIQVMNRIDGLLHAADAAMYEVKRRGKNAWSWRRRRRRRRRRRPDVAQDFFSSARQAAASLASRPTRRCTR